MDNVNLKLYIPAVLASFAVGGILGYYSIPTKIKTVTEVKTEVKLVKNNVVVDRVITKIVKADGTITEVTTEKDRSVIDSKDTIKSESKTTEITNPKYLSLGIAYKGTLNDFSNILDYRSNIGVEFQYDTGFFNTYIGGSIFGDTTTIISIGVRL